MKIKFLGAAQTVTGSRTLISHRGYKTLVDCGLFQGPKSMRLLNWEAFPYSSELDSIILTHAHIDHSGFLPRVVKEGFDGPVYSSPGTFHLCKILLPDSAHLQAEDAGYANVTGHSHHKPALPLYTVGDVDKALKKFQVVKRNIWQQISSELSIQFLRAGHIIGASFVQMSYRKDNGVGLITFSGDIGNNRSPTLNGPVNVAETDYLVLESTYGNRIQPRTSPADELEYAINKVISRGGVLIIPAFSVGRSQDMLFLIRKLEEDGRIPKVPVFLDSPMSADATEIFLRHPEDHKLVLNGDIFQAPLCPCDFHVVTQSGESESLTLRTGAFIVISAAGMLTGGRILHHLKTRLPDPKNGVLFTGYQAEETKGRLLQSGIDELRIHHTPVKVRAEIFTLEALSAHADLVDILDWLKGFKRPPKKIFINHGEPEASKALAEQIRLNFGYEAVVPKMNEEFELD